MSQAIGRIAVLFTLVVIGAVSISAQLDPTFGTGGRTQRIVPNNQSTVGSFLLADGKILLVVFNLQPGDDTYSLVRYNADGTLDTNFGVNGETVLQIPFTGECCGLTTRWIHSVILQPDGKIVAAGQEAGSTLVVRLNQDGTPDSSFSGDGVDRRDLDASRRDEVTVVSYRPDGKLILVGRNPLELFLMRYEANGNLDPTYGNEGGIRRYTMQTSSNPSAGFQSDEKVVVSTGTQTTGRIRRFNADGSLDNTFTEPAWPFTAAFSEVLIQADDKIVAVDQWAFTDSLFRGDMDVRVTRLTSGGSLDTSFGGTGTVVLDIGHMRDGYAGIIQKPDGSLVVGASTEVEPNRWIPAGGPFLTLLQVDSGGNITGRSLEKADIAINPANLLVQPDGKIIFATMIDTVPGSGSEWDTFLTRHSSVPLENYRFRAAPYDLTVFPSPTGMSQPGVIRVAQNGSRHLFLGIFANSKGNFGVSTDIDATSDYFGNFIAEPAYFRPSTGTWFIDRASYFAGANYTTVRWGLAGDIPVPEDYDGNGKSNVAVFRPSDGNWYIRGDNDAWYRIIHWGLDGDKPVPGDYDGDGEVDVAVWRPSNGAWYILRSSDGGATIVGFGLNGDIPVQEDFDGDHKTDVAVWRPSEGVWYIWRSSDGGYDIGPFGISTDYPTPADYDGDGKADPSVWRAGTWYQYRSTTNSATQFPYGIAGDVPFQRRF